MAESIDYYLIDKQDIYRPVNPKPSLQAYDNYQIYNMHCIDINYQTIIGNTTSVRTEQKINTLAVQAYSPHPILCDFNQIVNQYP